MDSVLIPWVIASTVLLFVALYWIFTVEKRLIGLEKECQRFLAFVANDDAATLSGFLQHLQQHKSRLATLEGEIDLIQQTLPHTLQGYAVKRYQAFANVGGDQSFSIAMVDGRGSGFLVSGLHGREETRVYAKPLVQWRASYSLSAEEQEVLMLARQMSTGEGAQGN